MLNESEFAPVVTLSPADVERFWRTVDRSAGASGCWGWLGRPDYQGHGRITIAKRSLRAARVAWQLTNGSLAPRALVLHRCDNLLCIQPQHLFLGTPADVSAGMAASWPCLRGDQHPRAKLTSEAVARARARYADGQVTQAELAAEYGVSRSAMQNAIRGGSWVDVPGAAPARACRCCQRPASTWRHKTCASCRLEIARTRREAGRARYRAEHPRRDPLLAGAARFWAKVDHSGDCWLWTGARDRDGYGRFRVLHAWRGAHRMAWLLARGPIPDGLHVLHRCDAAACVRPEHLKLGTHAENMADMAARGRARAKLTPLAVKEARAAHAGGVGYAKLAARYGVAPETMRAAMRGETWRHVDIAALCHPNERTI